MINEKEGFDAPQEIENSIYVGSLSSASNKEYLQQQGITHILIAARLLPMLFPSDFFYLRVEIDDTIGEDLLSHIPTAIAFLQQARDNGGGVLIHCAAGVSRSASIAIAYLMKTKSIPYATAFDMVKEKRPCILPNPSFARQLAIYYNIGCKGAGSSEYNVHRMEYLRKKERGFTFATSNAGLDPQEFLEANQLAPSEEESESTPPPLITKSNSYPSVGPENQFETRVYCCQHCHRYLFTDISVIKTVREVRTRRFYQRCDSFVFSERMSWMKGIGDQRGRLSCPGCANEIGSYTWDENESYNGEKLEAPVFRFPKTALKQISYTILGRTESSESLEDCSPAVVTPLPTASSTLETVT